MNAIRTDAKIMIGFMAFATAFFAWGGMNHNPGLWMMLLPSVGFIVIAMIGIYQGDSVWVKQER